MTPTGAVVTVVAAAAVLLSAIGSLMVVASDRPAADAQKMTARQRLPCPDVGTFKIDSRWLDMMREHYYDESDEPPHRLDFWMEGSFGYIEISASAPGMAIYAYMLLRPLGDGDCSVTRKGWSLSPV